MSDPAPATARRVRVVVVDDHPLFRQGLRSVVEHTPSLELVGEAASGDEAIDIAGASRPDVVVMDLHMPGTNGVDATTRILADHPEVRVLILTMADEDSSLRAALRAGARGYTLKGAPPADIVQAIHTVATGMSVFSAELAERMTRAIAAPAPPAAFPELTGREREILALLGRGRSNPAIARLLDLSEKTVRNNVSIVLAKLQVIDREAAGARAREAGLCD